MSDRRRAPSSLAPLALLALLTSIAGGCSSSSTTAATAPSDTGTASDADTSDVVDTGLPTGGGAPDCQNACCQDPRPAVGLPCATADDGLRCETSTTCAGGLILPWSLVCAAGSWTAEGGNCDVGGGVADNGCPDAQPIDGTPCGLPDGTWCQYALLCPPQDCDAGAPSDASADAAGDGASAGTGCASVAGKVGPAFCRAGTWQTTPLGSCP